MRQCKPVRLGQKFLATFCYKSRGFLALTHILRGGGKATMIVARRGQSKVPGNWWVSFFLGKGMTFMEKEWSFHFEVLDVINWLIARVCGE